MRMTGDMRGRGTPRGGARWRRWAVRGRGPRGLLAAVLLVAAAAACSSDSSGPDDPKDEVVEIHMTTDFEFDPEQVVIAPGTKVRWINDGNFFHTVTPQDTLQPGVWKAVETGSAGPVFDFTFTVPGQTYVYRCEQHSTDFANGMVGRIVVQAQ